MTPRDWSASRQRKPVVAYFVAILLVAFAISTIVSLWVRMPAVSEYVNNYGFSE